MVSVLGVFRTDSTTDKKLWFISFYRNFLCGHMGTKQ